MTEPEITKEIIVGVLTLFGMLAVFVFIYRMDR